MSDKLEESLRQRIADRQVAVVIGAGVSLAATNRDPRASWVGLLEHGIEHCREFANPRVSPERLDLWKKQIEIGRADPNATEELLAVAENIRDSLGGRDRGEYRAWLRAAMEPLAAKPGHGAALDAIRDLCAPGLPLFTTNYDDLLEKATGGVPSPGVTARA